MPKSRSPAKTWASDLHFLPAEQLHLDVLQRPPIQPCPKLNQLVFPSMPHPQPHPLSDIPGYDLFSVFNSHSLGHRHVDAGNYRFLDAMCIRRMRSVTFQTQLNGIIPFKWNFSCLNSLLSFPLALPNFGPLMGLFTNVPVSFGNITNYPRSQ